LSDNLFVYTYFNYPLFIKTFKWVYFAVPSKATYILAARKSFVLCFVSLGFSLVYYTEIVPPTA